jgi:hypothetical protein
MSESELSQFEADELRRWADMTAWTRYDELVRALYRRGVSAEAMAKARGVSVAMIEEVLLPPSVRMLRGTRR